MAIELVFSRLKYTGGAIDLVFGSSGGTLPALPLTATLALSLGGPRVTMTALYDNRLPWVASTSTEMRHQSATPAEARAESDWSVPRRIDALPAAGWQSATDADALPAARWQTTVPTENATAASWQSAAPMGESIRAVYQVCTPVELLAAIGWQKATASAVAWLAPHQVATGASREPNANMRQGSPLHWTKIARHQVGTPALIRLANRWQEAQPLPPGLSIYVPPGTGDGAPRVVDLNIVFACPPYEGGPVELVFGRVCGVTDPELPPGTLYILPARYYMAVHSLTAQLLPSLQPIPIFGVTMQADAGSFARSLTLTGPYMLFDLLAPVAGVPQMLKITLDGIEQVFVISGISEGTAFGKTGAQIKAKSVTTLIGSPRARETARLSTAARTAQQLALEALEYSGVDLDWQLTDWLVPAGQWSHLGTPLAAVQAIVEAAGGYLQSHRTLPTLIAMHPYPTLPGGGTGGPWNWGGAFAADVELAADAIITRAVDRTDGADVDGVYLAGSYGAFVKREGTAGAKLAGLITDPLITASEVARQRGLAILGAAGAKHLVQIDTGLLTGPSQPGLMEVGQLIQINAAQPWRGRVRSASITAAHGQEVVQSLAIERHLEVA